MTFANCIIFVCSLTIPHDEIFGKQLSAIEAKEHFPRRFATFFHHVRFILTNEDAIAKTTSKENEQSAELIDNL